MKIRPGSARNANYYDLRIVTVVLNYAAAAIAPHADVQRATYTIPAGYAGMIQEIKLAVIRDVVTAGLGIVQAYVRLTPGGLAAHNISLAWFNALAVASGDKVVDISTMALWAGDQIELRTADVSAGGSCTYDCCVTLAVFPA